MKLIIILFAIPIFFIETVFANINFSIKPGPSINQVYVFANFSTSVANTKITQFEVVLGYNYSDITGSTIAPTIFNWVTNPALDSKFASPYTISNTGGNSTQPSGYTYHYIVGTLGLENSNAANTIAGELLLGTITFQGGNGAIPIYLFDWADNGNDQQANTYIVQSEGNFFNPTLNNSIFYSGSSGVSTAYLGTVAAGTNSFVKVSPSVALPNIITNFLADKYNDSVRLAWSLSTEVLGSNFIIERSNDGKLFSVLTKIAAIGSGSHNYYTMDTAPLDNTSFYRLKIVNIDGSFFYSQITTINRDNKKHISVYPLPAHNYINVNISMPSLYGTVARLIDINGSIIKSLSISNDILQIDLSNLVTGIYFLNFADGSSVKLLKK